LINGFSKSRISLMINSNALGSPEAVFDTPYELLDRLFRDARIAYGNQHEGQPYAAVYSMLSGGGVTNKVRIQPATVRGSGERMFVVQIQMADVGTVDTFAVYEGMEDIPSEAHGTPSAEARRASLEVFYRSASVVGLEIPRPSP
jgi:hypothetical protein